MSLCKTCTCNSCVNSECKYFCRTRKTTCDMDVHHPCDTFIAGYLKILICGDRNWTDESSILNVLNRLITAFGKRIMIIEGECPYGGADLYAKEGAIKLGLKHKGYAADWDKYGRKAGPIRNQKMIDKESPAMVIAFHSNIEKSKGTKDMVNRATKTGIPCYLFKK